MNQEKKVENSTLEQNEVCDDAVATKDRERGGPKRRRSEEVADTELQTMTHR